VTLGAKQLASVRDAVGAVNLWHGSIRAGKTIGSLVRWMLFLANAPLGGELVIIGRTRDAAWRNVISPLQDPSITGTAAALVVGNYGAPTVTILGRRIHVLGASDAKAELVIRGMTVAGAYVDEVTTIPEQFFTQLLGRMSVRGAKLFGTTNPDNPAHWLKRKFIDRINALPHWRVFHFTMDDNPSLTPEYIAQKRLEFTGLWYRRFILGEWVAAEGAVYSMWDPARHVIPHAKLPRMTDLVSVGVDHGMTNPSAGILLGLGEDRRLYVVDEWWLDGATVPGGVTVAAQSASLRGWLGQRRPRTVVVDPAAAALRIQLQVDGLAGLATAENDIAYGIPVVASLLGQGLLKVADTCTNLIREIPGYSWDPKQTEKGEDKPIKVADHALDAWRYGLVTTERLWRPIVALAA